MHDNLTNTGGSRRKIDYKWIALSNTTISIMLAFINSSSVLLALPVIFRGIGIDRWPPAVPITCSGY